MSQSTDVSYNVTDGLYPSVPFSPINPSKSPCLTLDDQFEEFHKNNPDVFSHLVGLARWQLSIGRKHISMKYLFEVMRYNSFLEGKAFKATNSFTAFYARLMPPDVAGMFNLRTPRRRTQVVGRSSLPMGEIQNWESHRPTLFDALEGGND